MNWKDGWGTLLLILLLTTAGTAAERTNKTKIDPYRHSLQELANAGAQVVIDTTWAYVTLDSGAVSTSPWIPLQADVWTGFPTLANYLIRLDSGSVAVWFQEYYWTALPAAVHADSTHVLWAANTPLSVPGQYVVPLPFYGGWRLRVFVKAFARSGFQAGYQTMRD